jgi:hypothetical protein
MMCLFAGVDPNEVDRESGDYPLHTAVRKNDLTILNAVVGIPRLQHCNTFLILYHRAQRLWCRVVGLLLFTCKTAVMALSTSSLAASCSYIAPQ